MSEEMKRFWVSWIQPTDDERPLTYPPNVRILGWWCSGYDVKDRSILCALVTGEDTKACLEAVLKDWPEHDGDWRFIEEKPNDWRPGSRFPLSTWMEDRIFSPKETTC